MKALIKKYNFVPVLLTFFVMGFCDVVGISTSYVKNDFDLSETVAGFVPSMVFVWFLLLGVPTALLMNRIGRKKTVQISNIVTFVGMLLPFLGYNIVSCLTAFALLGIGNTMLQVSLNPLLTNVVKGDKLTSCLTAGQVVKAVSSFCGPFIALFAVQVLGAWQYLFPIFGLITLLSWALLGVTGIDEEPLAKGTSVGEAFSILKDGKILMFFFGILFVVGVDVGTNTVAPKLLMERCGAAIEKAALASSVYFICRTGGALLGSVLLSKMKESLYMTIHILGAIASLVALFFIQGQIGILVCIGAIGYFCSSIFPAIFGLALKARPEKANEISGLMITAICGGGIVTPLMGFLTDRLGSQAGSLIVIAACMAYLLFLALASSRQPAAQKS